MRVHVEDAQPGMLGPVLEDIRPADLREWYAGTGCPDISKCLMAVFEERRYARAAIGEDGRLLAMWGVDDALEPDVGSVWLFATNKAVEVFLPIHRHLKHELGAILDRWPTLMAYADARNTVHHKWLEWLKFKHEGTVHLQPFGLPFKIYSRRR